MKANDMYPSLRLVDIVTNETVGFIMDGVSIHNGSNEKFKIALSLNKIREICPDFASYMQYTGDSIEDAFVLHHNNGIVRESAILNLDDDFREFADSPYERIGNGKYAIYGYTYHNRDMIPLDDEVALARALNGGD